MASNFFIKTSRIGLHIFKASDEADRIRLNADEDVMRYFPSTLTEAESCGLMQAINSAIDARGFGMWAAELLETGRFIGFVGLWQVGFEASFTPAVEIGWRLAKEFWGRGLATEAANGCLEYAFGTLGLSEVISFTSEVNERSARVMQRIGMTRIALFDHPEVEKGTSCGGTCCIGSGATSS